MLRQIETSLHLEVHMQTHNLFSCSQFTKKFRHQWHLTKHEKMHAESGFNKIPEYPYSCTECERRFSDIPGLKQHLVVHSDVRAFSCKGCGKSFKRRPGLTNHKCNLKTDSGEKRSQCASTRTDGTGGIARETVARWAHQSPKVTSCLPTLLKFTCSKSAGKRHRKRKPLFTNAPKAAADI